MQPFCADIWIYDPTTSFAIELGRPWRCVMTGSAGSTAEESFANAEATLRDYYLNDPDGPRYAKGRIVVHELCTTCGGCGQVRKGKRPARLVPCPACRRRYAVGAWPVAESIDIRQD